MDPVPPPPAPTPTFFASLLASLKAQLGTWLLALVLGVLALFSDRLIGSIKFALNKADLRATNYEQLSTDLSDYVFESECIQEAFEHNWTSIKSITPLANEYNDAVTKLRRKEFVDRSWVLHYWGHDREQDLITTFDSLRKFDRLSHSLNGEFEALKPDGKLPADKAGAVANEMKPVLDELHANVNKLLTELL